MKFLTKMMSYCLIISLFLQNFVYAQVAPTTIPDSTTHLVAEYKNSLEDQKLTREELLALKYKLMGDRAAFSMQITELSRLSKSLDAEIKIQRSGEEPGYKEKVRGNRMVSIMSLLAALFALRFAFAPKYVSGVGYVYGFRNLVMGLGSLCAVAGSVLMFTSNPESVNRYEIQKLQDKLKSTNQSIEKTRMQIDNEFNVRIKAIDLLLAE